MVAFCIGLGLVLPAGTANAQRACGDEEFDAFDEAATLVESLEKQMLAGEFIVVELANATVVPLSQLAICEGVLGRRALLFLARAHTLRGDSGSQNVALSLLRQRDLSPEEQKDLDARYPPDSEERVPPRTEPGGPAPAASEASPGDRVRSALGSGVGHLMFERSGNDLRFRAMTDEADAVRALVVRWNPTGGGWQRVVLEGQADDGGTVWFATTLTIPKQGRCFVQITAKRRKAPAADSPEFGLNTKEMGGSTVRLNFVVASHGILNADSWYEVDLGTVRVAVRRHGSAVRVTVTTHLFDGVDGAVIRWNPIGGGWLSKGASQKPVDGLVQGFAANLSVPSEGPCLIEILLKRQKGDARLTTFEIDTKKLSATMAVTKRFSPWR